MMCKYFCIQYILQTLIIFQSMDSQKIYDKMYGVCDSMDEQIMKSLTNIKFTSIKSLLKSKQRGISMVTEINNFKKLQKAYLKHENQQRYKNKKLCLQKYLRLTNNLQKQLKQKKKELKQHLKSEIKYFLAIINNNNGECYTGIQNILQQYQKSIDQKIQLINNKHNIEFMELRLKQQIKKVDKMDPGNQDQIFIKQDLAGIENTYKQYKQHRHLLLQQYHKINKQFLSFLNNNKQRILHFNQQKSKMLTPQKCNLVFQKIKQISKNVQIPPYQQNYQTPTKSKLKIQTVSPYGVAIDNTAFECLQPNGWLTTNIFINLIQYLKQSKKYNNSKYIRKLILNQSQFGSMSDKQKFYENYKYITLNYDQIGIIMNKNNIHWYFIGILPKQQKILIYNSLPSAKSQYNKDIKIIQNYIKFQQQLMKANQNYTSSNQDYQIIQPNTPKQTNGNDCGLCTIINMMHFFHKKYDPKNKSIQYKLQKIPLLRKGLYRFLTYLVYCKINSYFHNYNIIQYCIQQLIFSPQIVYDI